MIKSDEFIGRYFHFASNAERIRRVQPRSLKDSKWEKHAITQVCSM